MQEPAVEAKNGHSELAQALMLFIPTAFDLIATVLMNVGLLSGAAGASIDLLLGSGSSYSPHVLNPAGTLGKTCHGLTLPTVWHAVTASVYQMMRGAEMLFAALFAVIFLRRRWGRCA